MLSKQICQACHYDAYNTLEHRASWSDRDESRWQEGKVICPLDVVNVFISGRTPAISEPPPRHCRFTVEHIVSQKVPEC